MSFRKRKKSILGYSIYRKDRIEQLETDVDNLKNHITHIHRIIGMDSFGYLSDRHIHRAISALRGQSYEETRRQVDLEEAPVAERLNKIEEILGVSFEEHTKRGYVKKKKK